MSPAHDEFASGENLRKVFEEEFKRLADAVTDRLAKLRDSYDAELDRRDAQWRREADSLQQQQDKVLAELKAVQGTLAAELQELRGAVAEVAASEESEGGSAPEPASIAAMGAEAATTAAAQAEGLRAWLERQEHIEVIDRRPTGGALWVVGASEVVRPILDLAKERGASFVFAKEGGRATKHQPAWFTTSKD